MKSLLIAVGLFIICGVEASPEASFNKDQEIVKLCNNEENCDQIWVEKPDLEGDENELLDENEMVFNVKSSENKLEQNHLMMGMGFKKMPKTKARESLAKCKVCKFAVKKLAKNIGKEKNKDRAETALNRMCKDFRIFKHQCQKEMDKYKDEIINMVTEDASEERICAKMNYCY